MKSISTTSGCDSWTFYRTSVAAIMKINSVLWIIVMLSNEHTETSAEIIFRVDPLALLSATLRTYQKVGCDTDQMSLSCPRGTSISIEVAQFGKSNRNDGLDIDELCPINDEDAKTNAANKLSMLASSITIESNTFLGSSNSTMHPTYAANDSRSNSILPSQDEKIPANCLWPNALQYSLLQTVVEACQKKKHCKFNALPESYGAGRSGIGDASGASSYDSPNLNPCPRIRKFVEIAYKCRPYEFRSKVACKNDVVQLECNPYSRIAIYSASFGRTEYESIQCPQPQGVREETCLASYATETVMQICHGRRRCNLSADTTTFGSPCSPQSRIYLKVVYTCVPKQVLKDRYESEVEHDEVEHFDGDENDIYDEDQFYKESEAIPKLQSNFTRISVVNISSTTEQSTSLNPLITQHKDVKQEDYRSSLYVYLLIAGVVSLLICLVLIIVRVVMQRRRNNPEDTTSSPKGETTISNGFNDSISEIDADIDLATPIPVPSVSKSENYITYGPATNLYGSLGPSNISHTSTTMLLPTNSLVCARQSPDIIGVTNTFVGQPTLGSTTAVGTVVPISSLAQYTTAPTTFHPSYIMDHEGILRRPSSSQPMPTVPPQHSQRLPIHYDGTAPRTLSSGVAQNPQFYYG